MNDGSAQRLAILRRDAEQKMLEPMKTHGWQAKIEREGPDFVIVVADRGGQTRRAALLYSSDTANAIYKSLANQVDCIFFSGEPYRVEQFVHGVNKPVASVSAFHSTLLEWNKASTSGKFAPVADAQELPTSAPDYRFMGKFTEQ